MNKSKLLSQENGVFKSPDRASAETETVLNLLKKVEELRNKGQLDQALEIIEQCIEFEPGLAAIYLARAEIYRQKARYEPALLDLTRAINLDAYNGQAYIQRGEIFRLLKQPQDALNDLNRAINLEPDNSLALGRRGTLYRNIKDFAKSLADYNRALLLDPASTWLYGNRAETYRGLKEYRKAVNDYTRVLTLNPSLSWVYERRSYPNLWLGYVESARADFERSWQVNPKNLLNGWMAEWAKICLKGFSFSASVEDRWEWLAECAPQHYAAYICRASLYCFEGDYAESYAEIETACEVGPDEPEAYFWKAMAAAGLKKTEEALDLIQDALELGLPPVLLSSVHQLKHINPAFYGKFDHYFLRKSGPASSPAEDESIPVPELTSNPMPAQKKEPQSQRAATGKPAPAPVPAITPLPFAKVVKTSGQEATSPAQLAEEPDADEVTAKFLPMTPVSEAVAEETRPLRQVVRNANC